MCGYIEYFPRYPPGGLKTQHQTSCSHQAEQSVKEDIRINELFATFKQKDLCFCLITCFASHSTAKVMMEMRQWFTASPEDSRSLGLKQ